MLIILPWRLVFVPEFSNADGLAAVSASVEDMAFDVVHVGNNVTVEDGWAKLGAALEISTVSHDGDDKVKDDVAGRLENDAFPTSPRPARPSVAQMMAWSTNQSRSQGQVSDPMTIGTFQVKVIQQGESG